MDFTPPTADQIFALRVNAGIDALAAQDRFATASPDMVEAIAEGIGQFAAGVWAPLSRVGDTEGVRLENGVVRLPAGYAEAYKAFVAAGWGAVAAPERLAAKACPVRWPAACSKRWAPPISPSRCCQC